MDHPLGLNQAATFVGGHWVDSKWKHLAEMLADYSHSCGINPPLELMWIPPDKRVGEDNLKAYAVVETKHGAQSIVCTAREDDQIQEILKTVFMADMTRHDIQAEIEASRIAWELTNKKRAMEEMEEKKELGKWMMGNNRFYSKYRNHRGDLVKVDENLRPMDPLRKHL